MISKLSEHGTAGFVLANGSMSTATSGEGKIRQQIIDNDLVDCMIALPGQLFYTTQIPVCLWFISRDKQAKSAASKESGFRNRKGETLFIDARNMGSMISRVHKELTTEDIEQISDTYHVWRSTGMDAGSADIGGANIGQGTDENSAYQDQAGYSKSATLEEIKANDYVLTPGRYVGAAPLEDDGIPFEKKMTELTQTLYEQLEESEKLDAVIRKNLGVLGYEE